VTVIFEDVLRDLLISINVVGSRVFLMRAPQVPAGQQKIPYIVFFEVGPSPMHDLRAALDVLDRTYQVSIFDTSQSRAIAISETLRTSLDGNRGQYEGVLFDGIFYRARTAAYENETKLFHIIQEYRILFHQNGLLNRNLPAVNTRGPKS
jgi:hypothetical protein